jgi:hypothetical protein
VKPLIVLRLSPSHALTASGERARLVRYTICR